MIAKEARIAVQGILNVAQDGELGSISFRAFTDLRDAPDNEPWPRIAKPATSGLTPALRAQYQRLWDTMVFRWEDDHKDAPGLEAIYEGLKAEFSGVVRGIQRNLPIYQKISQLCGGTIPADFIGVIHNLECGLNLKEHLHNGDPLTARTVLVPAGRPKAGQPPFTFEESAVDALTMPGKAYHLETDWSIPAVLYRLEGYNGYGYLKSHPSVFSPYLWSGSNHYERGKYVADHVWSDSAVSKQLGAALVLRELRKSA